MSKPDSTARTSNDKGSGTALPHGEFFPDAELVSWIGEHYGLKLAEHVAEIFADDPQSIRGFTRAVRRSVTHEIEERS